MDEVVFEEFAHVSRPVREADLAGFFDGWARRPSESVLRSVLAGSYCSFVARTSDGRVVGFASAISDGILSASVPLLEVLPAYRGRGIGSRLLQLVLGRLEGLYMVDLTCDEELVPFYRRFGLTEGRSMGMRRPDAIPSM
jgi:ribosomal protein S18 acetylase RimI-like enzyme